LSAPKSAGRPNSISDRPLSLAQQKEWIAKIKSIESPEVARPSDWLDVGLFLFVAGLALLWIHPLWRGFNERRGDANSLIPGDTPAVAPDYA
jgi:hypothetical protein